MTPTDIRRATPADRDAWRRLRLALWPDAGPDEMALILTDPAQAAFLAVCGGAACGFVEASVRGWAEGCDEGPVGYIEGWYVDPAHRRQGVGRALVRAAEQWAAARGCRWMGSDAHLDNTLSHDAHRALGYRAVEKGVCFSRRIADGVTAPRRDGWPLVVLPETFAVVRLGRDEAVPPWAAGPLLSVTRTADELSVVCPAAAVPAGARQVSPWRALRVAGTVDLALVGVLASVLAPLAEAGVGVFVMSTFETDYVLVRADDLVRARAALGRAGHDVSVSA